MTSRYASDTSVPVDRSRSEIEKMLGKFGADQFGYGSTAEAAMVQFRARGRMIRFTLPMPNPAKFRLPSQRDQAMRSAWRALVLSIKAKIVAVEANIVTFEEEFMSQTVMPDGLTVAQHALPKIKTAYAESVTPTLLPHFK
jgi:hypothetical protein